MADPTHDEAPIRFETHPSRYRHWKLDFPATYGGRVARLAMDVQEDGGLRPGYPMKLNSYDLGVDIELADAISRVRFEHPEVRALVVTSAKDRIFCSGANIYMLGSSTHTFKVNFCKYTNETRLYLEELSALSGVPVLCAVNGTASGGGYELALACDEILLQDDGSTAVSLPEAPLLAVLPGTGGLTRVTDKRKVRRDLADVFSTLAEGVRGKRAVDWRLVDESASRSKFEAALKARVEAMVARSPRGATGEGLALPPVTVTRTGDVSAYKHVLLQVDRGRRVAELTMRGPEGDPRAALTAEHWSVAAWRELDDALLDLRFNHPTVGLVVLHTVGDIEAVRAFDRSLVERARSEWLAREVLLLQKRVLKRLDLTARSLFALVEPASCFAGSMLELALAADRVFMIDAASTHVALSVVNFGAYPMSNGLTRLESRFLYDPSVVTRLKDEAGLMDAGDALKAGLVTFTPDEMDWDDEVRVAIEERTSLSPDAMTGMEANLRFAGPETMETKIFGRLSAWQNWIFQRPNAVGTAGALTMYGQPGRPVFDYRRT
ncbi:MAG: 2,3-epoxybenzoyl-CoA dihydrolase [Deltaproteobacteria bacterium]|nr:2,3-epoxybenzoyl-CoA dihydrolase [Myxococcales bacterium]MDP3217906.1 2,3-epoxybenzoyl-CoA dihydrolase [Deltaproteobacteria bacterium]